ncbi:hypothetical protein BC835DRAFT_1078967 [Cytidiella melzeri]|nr:hypothetical protein BC835DRAFT_1078967 [Cytidiella melzeri]
MSDPCCDCLAGLCGILFCCFGFAGTCGPTSRHGCCSRRRHGDDGDDGDGELGEMDMTSPGFKPGVTATKSAWPWKRPNKEDEDFADQVTREAVKQRMQGSGAAQEPLAGRPLPLNGRVMGAAGQGNDRSAVVDTQPAGARSMEDGRRSLSRGTR